MSVGHFLQFYDTVPAGEEGPLRKRRLHYHDFMQEVHAQMHEAKKAAPPRDYSKWDTHQRFDPIPPVGDAVLEQMNMLCLDEFQARLTTIFCSVYDSATIMIRACHCNCAFCTR